MAEAISTSKLIIEGVDDASAVVVGIGEKIGSTLGDIQNKMGEVATKSSGLKDVLTTGLGTAVDIIGTNIMGFVAGAGADLLNFIGDSFSGAAEAAEGQRKLNDAINRLGAESPVTADAAGALADKYKDLAGGSDDAIASAETVLLKFKGIKSDAFEPALKTSLDLSAALGISLTEASNTVGKALVSPGEGLGRLKSAGVAFSDEQEKVIKAMVETGDVAGAQKLIMDKLAETTGGAAASKAGTFAGEMAIMQETIADAGESMAGELLPVINELVKEVLPVAMPIVKEFAEGAVNAFKDVVAMVRDNWPAIKPIISEVFNVIGALWKDPVQPVIGFLLTALKDVANFVSTNFPTIKQNFQNLFTSIGLIIETGKLAIKSVTEAVDTFSRNWNTSWEAVDKFFRDTWDGITKFMDGLVGTFARIGESISKSFLGAFTKLGDMLRDLVLAPVRAIVKSIRDALTPILNTPIIGGLAQEALKALPQFAEGGVLRAGQVGIVGEKGAELVSFNRTARIIPADQTSRIMNNSGAGVSVTVNVGSVANDIDIENMAYRVAEAIRKRI